MPRKKSQKASRGSSPELQDLLRLVPGYDPFATAGDCVFEPKAAQHALDFFDHPKDGCLRHVKGEKAGERFKLEPWQAAIVANLFGWRRPDGSRRYREAFIFIPRKNGKTTLAAGLVLFGLVCDGEAGAEIYSAAGDREQASLIYQQVKGMVLQEPEFKKRLQVYETAKSVVFAATNSSYKVISHEANTKWGFNSHMFVVDEVHAQPNRDLVDALKTSTGARRQPLGIYITTSDFDRPSICNELYAYAGKVRDGLVEDPSFLPVIYEASRDDDWTQEAVWRKANPNLGVSISLEYMQRECKRAREEPTSENTFKRFHLNIRTEQDVRWMPMKKWDACPPLEAQLRGRPCYAGLDLASTTDIAAFVLVFPEDGNAVLPFFWVPAENAEKRERKDRVPYLTWGREGLIELTPGNVVDYDRIRARVNELRDEYDIREIAIDRWNSQQLQTQLEGDGFEVVAFGQGYFSMSAPTKELMRLVLECNLRHGGHPIMRWMASNVTVEQDAAGNLKPARHKSTEKIDGIVAMIMALGRSIVRTPMSIYESRGIIEL